MNDQLKNAFSELCQRFGSHCAAAEKLGIARDHYRRLRNGRANIPQRTAEYILLKAKEAAEEMPEISQVTPARQHEPAQAAHP